MTAGIRSVALIPLRRQDRLQGSLNFGSSDERRFSRHLATDFLAHLGVIASFAIENTINRARLVRSGLTDFLTGWHNRRYLNARLKEELARAQRQGTSLTCLLIDLDRFKQINDQHGHLAGDMALREAAQRVDAHIRGSDAAARFGGDEFVVLAPGITPDQAARLAERIRLAVMRDAAGDSARRADWNDRVDRRRRHCAGARRSRFESGGRAAARRCRFGAVSRQAEGSQSRRARLSVAQLSVAFGASAAETAALRR